MKKTIHYGQPIRFYDCVDSTNIQAKREADQGAENGTVILADMQTAGKGRRGRSWESPAGKNLYFTLILRPDFAPDKASMLTLVMALAVVKGIERTLCNEADEQTQSAGRLVPMIKWPNDILLENKKVCGILTEMNLQQNQIEYVLIGVGVNVYKQNFAGELVDKATSLEAEYGQRLSRSHLMGNITEAFEEYYSMFRKDETLKSLRDLYNQKLINRGREVRVLDPQGEYTGIATGINETGELSVRLPDGSETTVYAGEVSVRGIYGYV